MVSMLDPTIMNPLTLDLTAMVLDHECRTQAYWARALALPLEEQIGVAPDELIDFIALDNIRQRLPETPRAPQPSPQLLADTHAALAELPAQVKRLLARRFAGIHFVADFGGTGCTEQILDADSRPVGAFVVLDPAILETATANAWATWRENTPFKKAPGHELRIEIEHAAQDNRKQAIQYILLHELGHVVAATHAVHPSWAIAPRDVDASAAFPFLSQSWSIAADQGSYVSHFDAEFPRRRDLVYYREPRLSTDSLASVYECLAKTNFATLYAATSPFEDFAESFAAFVHVSLMHKPYVARIYREHELVTTFRPELDQPRLREKMHLLEEILEAA